jgi:hypothetical protein
MTGRVMGYTYLGNLVKQGPSFCFADKGFCDG